jgi:hypothetical protein
MEYAFAPIQALQRLRQRLMVCLGVKSEGLPRPLGLGVQQ